MSFISSKTGSFPVAEDVPFEVDFPLVPLLAGREGTPSSSRRFFEAGSEDGGLRLQMWSEIWLNSSI